MSADVTLNPPSGTCVACSNYMHGFGDDKARAHVANRLHDVWHAQTGRPFQLPHVCGAASSAAPTSLHGP